MKKLSFDINTDVYYQQIRIIMRNKPRKEINEYLSPLKKKYAKNAFKCSGKFISHEDYHILWIPKIPDTPFEHGILAHEIFHAAIGILRRVGIKCSNKTEEAYAYLIGHITTQIYEKINLAESK